MSEHFVHNAIMEDATAIVFAKGAVGDVFRKSVTEQFAMSSLGCTTNGGDKINPYMLEKLREIREMSEMDRCKLSFIIGCLTHRAADRVFKPIFRALDVSPSRINVPTDCTLYHEVEIINRYYGNTADIMQSMLGEFEGTRLEGKLEEFGQAMLRRSLVALHTLTPDKDVGTWLEAVSRLTPDFVADVKRHTSILTHPDTEKRKKFVLEPNFYDEENMYIKAAMAIRAGKQEIPEVDFDLGYDEKGISLYEQALRCACEFVIAGWEYFNHEIDEQKMREKLRIGMPGADGKPV